MPRDKYAYWKRKWLNRKGFESTAFVYATVNERWNQWLDGGITISDCSRQITLDFMSSDDADFKNCLYKLDTLIEVLQEYRDAYEAEWNKE